MKNNIKSFALAIGKGVLTGFIFTALTEINAVIALLPLPDIVSYFVLLAVPVGINILCGYVILTEKTRRVFLSLICAVISAVVFFKFSAFFVNFLKRLFGITSDFSLNETTGFGFAVIISVICAIILVIVLSSVFVERKFSKETTEKDTV